MRRKGSEKNAYMQEKCVIYEHSHQNLSYMFFFLDDDFSGLYPYHSLTTPVSLPYHSVIILYFSGRLDSLLLLVASDDFAIVLNP